MGRAGRRGVWGGIATSRRGSRTAAMCVIDVWRAFVLRSRVLLSTSITQFADSKCPVMSMFRGCDSVLWGQVWCCGMCFQTNGCFFYHPHSWGVTSLCRDSCGEGRKKRGVVVFVKETRHVHLSLRIFLHGVTQARCRKGKQS